MSEQKEASEKKEPYKEKTIEVTKAGKARKVLIREIPIIWEGKEEIVEIKKMSFGERAQYSEKFVNIQVKGEFQDVSVSLAQMQIQSIVMGTHKAPFPINEDYITHELDADIGDLLSKEIESFNKLSAQKKKTSDGQSKTDQKTKK
jgi:hypothetical protein